MGQTVSVPGGHYFGAKSNVKPLFWITVTLCIAVCLDTIFKSYNAFKNLWPGLSQTVSSIPLLPPCSIHCIGYLFNKGVCL